MKPIASLLTVKEAAARLTQLRGAKVSTQSVYRAINAKKNRLPVIRMGHSVFVPDLDGWLAAQAEASVSSPDAATQAAMPAPATRVRRRTSKAAKARVGKRNPFGTPAARPRVSGSDERRVG